MGMSQCDSTPVFSPLSVRSTSFLVIERPTLITITRLLTSYTRGHPSAARLVVEYTYATRDKSKQRQRLVRKYHNKHHRQVPTVRRLLEGLRHLRQSRPRLAHPRNHGRRPSTPVTCRASTTMLTPLPARSTFRTRTIPRHHGPRTTYGCTGGPTSHYYDDHSRRYITRWMPRSILVWCACGVDRRHILWHITIDLPLQRNNRKQL